MKTFRMKVYRDYPAVQYGVATVKAKTQADAKAAVEFMNEEVEFDWSEPDIIHSGDNECGDINIEKVL